MIRVVFDTNVLISVLLSPGGVPGQLVQAWREERLSLCLSEELLAELEEVVARPHLRKAATMKPKLVKEFLERLRKDAEFHVEELILEPTVPTDPDDDVIVATAVATNAQVIVSGDSDLFEFGEEVFVFVMSF